MWSLIVTKAMKIFRWVNPDKETEIASIVHKALAVMDPEVETVKGNYVPVDHVGDREVTWKTLLSMKLISFGPWFNRKTNVEIGNCNKCFVVCPIGKTCDVCKIQQAGKGGYTMTRVYNENMGTGISATWNRPAWY
mmetsp:Transcript_9956/g.17627  ORF Transcript_9956/g.17627 Transcript_9956/m.17627 type:complete len:136 (+) Transcript_9956:607-1014(+)